jgi:hypothetical protein
MGIARKMPARKKIMKPEMTRRITKTSFAKGESSARGPVFIGITGFDYFCG